MHKAPLDLQTTLGWCRAAEEKKKGAGGKRTASCKEPHNQSHDVMQK